MLGKKAEVPQFCVFIEEEKLETLCFGRVGSSNRYCLAPRDFPYSHCGVTAHGKGSNAKKKYTPMVNSYYVHGGVAGGGRPTAKMGPYVRLEDIPQHLLVKFEKDKESAETWEGLIMEAIMYTEDKDDDDYKMKTNIEEDPPL